MQHDEIKVGQKVRITTYECCGVFYGEIGKVTKINVNDIEVSIEVNASSNLDLINCPVRYFLASELYPIDKRK